MNKNKLKISTLAEYSGFKVTGIIEWGKKSKHPKSLGFKQNPNTSPDQNLTPKKSHAKFPSHKNFQKVFNNITQKIET